MKVKSPQSIYLKGHRQQAVLLLHSFTGTVRDVKHLAQQLNEEDLLVTCLVIQATVCRLRNLPNTISMIGGNKLPQHINFKK